MRGIDGRLVQRQAQCRRGTVPGVKCVLCLGLCLSPKAVFFYNLEQIDEVLRGRRHEYRFTSTHVKTEKPGIFFCSLFGGVGLLLFISVTDCSKSTI